MNPQPDRPVTELSIDDRERWEQLYRQYADFYQVPMTSDILNTVWSWIQDPGQAFYALGARRGDGELIGFMHFRAMPSPLRGRMVGFLDDLFVDPALRGKGVVDALFNALEQQAAERGWPLVRWITAENNYRGRGVYDRVAQKTHWLTYQLDVPARTGRPHDDD